MHVRKAHKKWRLYSHFFSIIKNAGKISNTLESAGPNSSVQKYCKFTSHSSNMRELRYYSTYLTIWGRDLSSRVGISLSKKEANIIKLPYYTKSIIIGLMLSKGRLQKSNKSSSNARLIIGSPLKNSIYIWYLFSLLSPYCSMYPYLYNRKTQVGPVELRTRSLSCITELYHEFYIIERKKKQLKKIVPLNIFKLLTREALAHWFIASKVFFAAKNGSVMLITSSFNLDEVIILMNVLLIKYELTFTLEIKESNYIILISKESYLKFKSLVDPYISNIILSLIDLNKQNYMDSFANSFSYTSPTVQKNSLLCGLSSINNSGLSSTSQNLIDPGKFQRQGINQQELDKLIYYANNKLANKSSNFLKWFIGFTEGDGSFVLSGGKSIFSIHLHLADLALLYIIQNELNMGNVYVKQNSAQFVVKAKKDIYTLITIFNGNLFLKKRQEQFNSWLVNYNIKNKTNIMIKSFTFKPSLSDNWLAGFIDAEGSFTAYVIKDKSLGQKFNLVQKAADLEMNYLSSLIGGIHYKEDKQMSRVHLAYSNCDSLIEYLSRHKLYSIKSTSFEKWKEIYDYRKNKPSNVKHDYPFLKKKVSLINQLRKVPFLK